MWEGFLMGMVPGKEIHNKSAVHSSDFNDQPVWLGGVGKDITPFSSVMQQVEESAKRDNFNYVPDHSSNTSGKSAIQNTVSISTPPNSSASSSGPLEKFEKIIATLDCDEIKTLRKIKIDAIRDAMNSGNHEALSQAQAEFKACSQALRLRASTLELAPQPGVSFVSMPANNMANSVEQKPSLRTDNQQTSSISGKDIAAVNKIKMSEPPVVSKNETAGNNQLPPVSKNEVSNNNQLPPVSNNKGSASEQVVNMQTISAINLSRNTLSDNIMLNNSNNSNGNPVHPTGNNRFGVAPIVWEAIQKNDSVKNTLLTFPLEAVHMYKTTPFEEKRLLFEQLQEKTKVMFVTVDHREAFIKGSAYGHNTFDFFKSKIEDEVKAGKLAKDAAGKRLATVEVFREMSQEQRKAFVDLLELDMKMAKI